MRRFAVLAAVLAVAAFGCDAGPVPSRAAPTAIPGSPPPSTSAAPPSPSAAPPTPAPAPTTADPTDASPTDPEPSRPDPAAFLQVCLPYPAEVAALPIACADAVATALAASAGPGMTPAGVRMSFTCANRAACPERSPERAYVTVLSAAPPVEVEVTRAGDGSLAATATRSGSAPEAPAFQPPSPGRAVLPGAPASLATRPAYPLCGEETAPMGGPYDEAARACFLTGVLAGSPVEFAALGSGTEGGAFVTLYRFAGTGGIEYVTGEAGRWGRSFTGIGPVGGGLVFDVDGMATARVPVP